RAPRGDPGGPADLVDPQGVRHPGGTAACRRGGALRRGVAGPGVGRAPRSVQQHRAGDGRPAAAQARRPAPDPHRGRHRIPAMRLPLRARLTALFAVVFVLAAGALLALTLVLVNRSLDQASAANAPAQREYVAQLEKSLQALQSDPSAGKNNPDAQKKQADLKRQLIEANAGASQAVRD